MNRRGFLKFLGATPLALFVGVPRRESSRAKEWRDYVENSRRIILLPHSDSKGGFYVPREFQAELLKSMTVRRAG